MKSMYIIIFLSLCLASCNENKYQSISTYDNLVSKTIDINSFINDAEMTDCNNYLLIDETCLEGERNKFLHVVRLSFINLHDTSHILTLSKINNKWIKVLKVIPQNHFGVATYYIQNRNILYAIQKNIDEMFEIDEFESTFEKLSSNNFANDPSLLRVEYLKNGVYSKKTSYNNEIIKTFYSAFIK